MLTSCRTYRSCFSVKYVILLVMQIISILIKDQLKLNCSELSLGIPCSVNTSILCKCNDILTTLFQ